MTFKNDVMRSFKPFVQVGLAPNAQWIRTPKISTADVNELHFGHSLLFIKTSNALTTYNFRIIVTCDVEFYTYTGNNGLAKP